jgi:hypothetical protein
VLKILWMVCLFLSLGGCVSSEEGDGGMPQKGDGVVRVYSKDFDLVWRNSLVLAGRLGLQIISEDKEGGGILLTNTNGSERVFVLIDAIPQQRTHTEVEVIWQFGVMQGGGKSLSASRAYWRKKQLESSFQDKLEKSLRSKSFSTDFSKNA